MKECAACKQGRKAIVAGVRAITKGDVPAFLVAVNQVADASKAKVESWRIRQLTVKGK